ncbi:hypothetical protein BLA29_007638 [Euroglyphus maynei]|uniref:Uncharacterized protein n=1 Tax=Euroglyphus maynei TaxID=6958 RepID=A0A1Y3BPE9_EURMA|nr:hypothetical protein BLA29_007638 [Euroglyphus maynei]
MDETNIEIQVSGKNQLKFIKTNLILGDRRLATILLNKIIPHINNDLFLEHVPFLLQNLANNLETLDAL